MLDKIERRPVSVFFREPMSPHNEFTSGYVERPKKPIDLRMIRKNLSDGVYKSINDWGMDVRQIWSNAQSSYTTDHPIYMIAYELSAWFEKKWVEYPRTEQEGWMKKVKKLRALVGRLNETMPIKRDLIPPLEDSKFGH
jgi:hypothetical protein